MVKKLNSDENKFSCKDITKAVLLIAAVGILIPTLVVAPGLGLALKPFLKKKNYFPSRINDTINRLKKQKFISYKEEGGQVRIELSEKGRMRVLKYQIEDLKLQKTKWDGLWRIVIFDIPEKKRAARDFLRSKLKEVGFFKLQKSVLVTPWECKDIVDFVKHYYDVSDHVNLILAKEVDEDLELKRYFKL